MNKPDRATRAAEGIQHKRWELTSRMATTEEMADIIRAEYQGAEQMAEYIKLYQDGPPNTVGWRQLRDRARRFLMED